MIDDALIEKITTMSPEYQKVRDESERMRLDILEQVEQN